MTKKSLLDKTFCSLPVLCIYQKDSFVLIPSGLTEFDTNITLLNEIFYHYHDDFARNRYLFEHFPPSALDEFNSFKIREIWRIGSFIVFALNIEQILKRRFEESMKFVSKFDPASANPYSNLVQNRQNEIDKYKYYRDKIFAHTAYGNSKKKDNLSMQATSSAYFNGTFLGISSDGIRLGGFSVVRDQAPPTFESFTFLEMASDFSKHFQEWYKMYHDICTILQNLTDEQIKPHIKGLVMIRRVVPQ